MSSEPVNTEGVPGTSGSPAPTLRPWNRRTTLAAAGIAAAIAALGGGAVYAAAGHTASPFAGPSWRGEMPGGAGPNSAAGFSGPLGPGGHVAGHSGTHDGAPLHGQVVVSDGAGGYVTVSSQTGVVTAVAPDSVTVRSKDGFTQVWTVTAAQRPAFTVDDSVMIRGEQTGADPVPVITQVVDPLVTPR